LSEAAGIELDALIAVPEARFPVLLRGF